MNMRVFLATISGLFLAFLVIGILNAISQFLLSEEQLALMQNIESVRANIDKIPVENKIIVIAAHFLSIIFGTLLARVISKGSRIPGYIIGGIIVVSASINFFYIKPETWFIMADGISVLLAFVLGMKISKKRKRHENNPA